MEIAWIQCWNVKCGISTRYDDIVLVWYIIQVVDTKIYVVPYIHSYIYEYAHIRNTSGLFVMVLLCADSTSDVLLCVVGRTREATARSFHWIHVSSRLVPYSARYLLWAPIHAYVFSAMIGISFSHEIAIVFSSPGGWAAVSSRNHHVL